MMVDGLNSSEVGTLEMSSRKTRTMQMRDFCLWLQGHFEMNGTDKALTLEQTKMVANHLNLVFTHMANPPVHHEDTLTEAQKAAAGITYAPLQTLEELLRRLDRSSPVGGRDVTVIC